MAFYFIDIRFKIFKVCVCICVCVMCMTSVHATVYMWRQEDNFIELTLPFHFGIGIELRSLGLHKCPYHRTSSLIQV